MLRGCVGVTMRMYAYDHLVSVPVLHRKQCDFNKINFAAILLSGNYFTKIEQIFEHLSIPICSRVTYNDVWIVYLSCHRQFVFKHPKSTI